MIATLFVLNYGYLAFVISWLLNLRFLLHHCCCFFSFTNQYELQSLGWNLNGISQKMVCIIFLVVHLCRCWHTMLIFFVQTERSVDMLLHGKKPLVEVNILQTMYHVWDVSYSRILLVVRVDNNMIYRKVNQDRSFQFFLYLYFLLALPVNVILKHDILTS